MKKITVLFLFIFALMLCQPLKTIGQSQEGIVTIDVGVGYSIELALAKEGGSGHHYGPNANATISTSVLPVLHGAVDYGLTKRFSLAATVSYQSAKFYWSNYPSSVTGQPIDFTEQISRLNFGLRPTFHFNHNNFDFYMGVRLGMSLYSDNNNSGDPNFVKFFPNAVLPSIQAVFGCNIYFTSFMGMQTEVCIGAPYFLEGGIVFKIGGKSNNEANSNQ